MAKLAPSDLAQVLSKLPKQNDENILVGYDGADDAGVYRLNDEISLVQTLDFFTPIADDPRIYGEIAAVNSLNDVYAMGGNPVTALSIVCYPQKGNWEVLGEILLGGHEKMLEEGVAILGGHSVDDQEMKFGYSVTGTVENSKFISNAGAQAGDKLILTKPIGTGVISTGVKFEKASDLAREAAIEAMTKSARIPSQAMIKTGANACTDITGFGLLGHAFELARASNVTLKINSGDVPLLPDVIELISEKMLTRGDKNNRVYAGETVKFASDVHQSMQSALYDPQTAGGLLISMPKKNIDEYLSMIPEAKIIGDVEKKEDYLIKIG